MFSEQDRLLKCFRQESLSPDQTAMMKQLGALIRIDVIEMTTRAKSGHVGGSLSSVDIFLVLWLCANISKYNLSAPGRDRIVVSHGHTSAGVYATLGNLDFFDRESSISGFRKSGSMFEGHPSQNIPGIEWLSGFLGQGLSVGCGFAMASKLKKTDYHTFVVMGDGEQQKGQVSEAMDLCSKYRLYNLTAIIDRNGLQASGSTETILAQDIRARYSAAGWDVLEIDGHDFNEIYASLRYSYRKTSGKPTLIIANTVMGKGISFIENNYLYHGKPLETDELKKAAEELRPDSLGIDFRRMNEDDSSTDGGQLVLSLNPGNPVAYRSGERIELRKAFGEALLDLINNNEPTENGSRIVAIDCDLAESVKLKGILDKFTENIIECGIQEHNAATLAGALSKSGIIPFFADFGVFGIDEVYSQLRMNDFNKTSVRLVATHNGLDVGEDGKTHQCVDYLSLLSNLHSFKIIIPADANQTDRVIRYTAGYQGNTAVILGRSATPVLEKEDGTPFYGKDYRFEPGSNDWLRPPVDCAIITYGNMTARALYAAGMLAEKGIKAGVLNACSPCEISRRDLAVAAQTGLIVTYEDHNISTGLGNIIGCALAEAGLRCGFIKMGINGYGISAPAEDQYKHQRLTENDLFSKIMSNLNDQAD